jgi:hypothetical protein
VSGQPPEPGDGLPQTKRDFLRAYRSFMGKRAVQRLRGYLKGIGAWKP